MYDDFTASNIFKKDKNNNTIYINNDKCYIVNDLNKQYKLRNIEGYRYFFQGTRKPVVLFLSIIFLGIPISFLLQYFYFPNLDDRITPFLIGFPIYLLALYIYNLKIKNIVKNCEIITDETISETIKIKQKFENVKPKVPLSIRIKSSLPDINIFHIVIFLIIMFPVLFVFFSILWSD